MVIKDQHWDAIKHRLTEAERREVKEATVATSLFPKEFMIDETQISLTLLPKLCKMLGIKMISQASPQITPGTPGDI